jgi:hypothetical protein
MFKRRRNTKEDRRGEGDNRKSKEENTRDKGRYNEHRKSTKGSDSMYEDECINLLRELSNLTSESSSLKFELYQLNETARIETMRLAAQISECEFYNKEKAEMLRKELDKYFKKYVPF